jgi:ATP-dependent Clp protease ATP-binding subunit ClpB
MQIEKYTDRLKALIQSAQSLALRSGHQQLTPLHVLKALLEDEDGLTASLIQAAGGNPKQVAQAVDLELAKLPSVEGSGAGQVYLSPETARLFDQAEQLAQRAGDEFVTVEYMLLAIALASGTPAANVPSRPALRRKISTRPSPTFAKAAAPRALRPSRAMMRSRNTRAISPRKRDRASSTR